MKISKSKQELARIISENGGWPRDAEYSSQDGSDGQVSFFKSGAPIYNKLSKIWNAPGSCVHMYWSRIKGLGRVGVIKNFHQTILSCAEYLHLYQAPDADGWIEWNQGNRPVIASELVDVKYGNGSVECGFEAGGYSWSWGGDGLKIIAYRLHKPDANPEFCESVTSSIPEPEKIEELAGVMGCNADIESIIAVAKSNEDWIKELVVRSSGKKEEAKPTIEQLAADYRNAKDYAERKQKEADAAKAKADAKLAELVVAGKEISLDVSPVTAKQDAELVISDWRDLQIGDEVEARGWVGVLTGFITEMEPKDYDGDRPFRFQPLGDRPRWCTSSKFKFIRRP